MPLTLTVSDGSAVAGLKRHPCQKGQSELWSSVTVSVAVNEHHVLLPAPQMMITIVVLQQTECSWKLNVL